MLSWPDHEPWPRRCRPTTGPEYSHSPPLFRLPRHLAACRACGKMCWAIETLDRQGVTSCRWPTMACFSCSEKNLPWFQPRVCRLATAWLFIMQIESPGTLRRWYNVRLALPAPQIWFSFIAWKRKLTFSHYFSWKSSVVEKSICISYIIIKLRWWRQVHYLFIRDRGNEEWLNHLTLSPNHHRAELEVENDVVDSKKSQAKHSLQQEKCII